MEELQTSSIFGIGNGGVRAKFRRLESEMNEFESNSDAWNREWKFEAWNRECRSSNQVLCLESEMEEFEPISDSNHQTCL